MGQDESLVTGKVVERTVTGMMNQSFALCDSDDDDIDGYIA